MALTDLQTVSPHAPATETRWFAKPEVRRALGRLGEFMMVGGASLIILPLAMLIGPSDGNIYVTAWVMFYVAYIVNDPHFMVSYQIFYRGARAKLGLGQGSQTGAGAGPEGPVVYAPAEVWRYRFAGLVVPAILLTWIGYGFVSSSAAVFGWMIHLMFLTVGWHYCKQGFGVLTVLSARRGVKFSNLERSAFLFHVHAAWTSTWVSTQIGDHTYEMDGISYTAINLDPMVATVFQGAFWLSCAGVALVLILRTLRERALPPLIPLTGYLVSIHLWLVFSHFNALFAYIIPALHSLQYWFFVALLEKGRDREARAINPRTPPFWRRFAVLITTTVALGLAFMSFGPRWLDGVFPYARDALGVTAVFASFAAFINIHHYFIDNVIWRRGNPEMRHLFSK
jgi:hypothetical protein